MITNESRLAALKTTPEHIVDMYGSLETARLLGGIRRKYNLQKGENFIDVVGDIMLGFYPKSDLKKLLITECGVDDTTATQIEGDLADFLSKIDSKPSVPEAPKDVKEKLVLRPEGVPQNSGAPGDSNNAKPLTREEVLRSLAPRRTMAGDIASINPKNADTVQGYEAYQNRLKK